MIKVFDGASSLKRRIYRVITVPRYFNLEQLLTASLRAFHISREPDVSIPYVIYVYFTLLLMKLQEIQANNTLPILLGL